MANYPSFTSVPRLGVASVSTANTNRDGSGTIVDIIVGVAAGTKINEIVVKATDNPADSVLTLFIHNGTSWFLFDEIDLGDPAAASTTVTGFRVATTYQNLVLPSTSHKLGAAVTVAPTGGVLVVHAFGGDLT